ncbi:MULTISPECIES: hypothetical protein [unclassified Rhizobium]|uniref:hypothetical protein n=1 Tax=unclassified Rhizobium TaxID=2613769 RepID=UPI001616F54B|nr:MULTISPECIES: hypothetical protein [unclassified Rhizobium]MBB3288748.1 hypothetical protein [Rhizobium sp. BK252]MBB3403490.1 hypothetical protein [Rhizobium sp. BK289]MBB3416325.1 hypothetical protein [Rhizobium sp. BK284]MBB3483953.1 hypothetical protein [Rhizobium sp. BK347]
MSFEFIPGPTGNGFTDQEFLASAIQVQKHHDDLAEQNLAFSILGLFILFLLIFIISKRKQVGDAGVSAFISAAAALIRGKRNLIAMTASLKARIYEEVDTPIDSGGGDGRPR